MSRKAGLQHFNENLGHIAAFQGALRLDPGMEAGRHVGIEAPEGFAFAGWTKLSRAVGEAAEASSRVACPIQPVTALSFSL